jgi:hypothetical protein
MLILNIDAIDTTQSAGDFLQEFLQLLPPARIWAFGAVSAIMGALVVIADATFFRLKGKSLLKLGYAGVGNTILNIILWGIGAGLVGILGAVFGLFQVNSQASMIVGLAWPVTLPRLIEAATTPAEDEQPS